MKRKAIAKWFDLEADGRCPDRANYFGKVIEVAKAKTYNPGYPWLSDDTPGFYWKDEWLHFIDDEGEINQLKADLSVALLAIEEMREVLDRYEKVEEPQFTKDDLKNNMVVITRNAKVAIYLEHSENINEGHIVYTANGCADLVSSFSDDLKFHGNREKDICEVSLTGHGGCSTIWTREE